ncbi:MAG: hypothetical protein IPJ47_07200 [Anaerolineales bacterium]|nr:hypothetical protein [Anaerolineales bacterium]
MQPVPQIVEMRLYHKGIPRPDPVRPSDRHHEWADSCPALHSQRPGSPRYDGQNAGRLTYQVRDRCGEEAGKETKACEAGLAPGQVRRGLRMLGQAIEAFEGFVAALGHDMYFVEPLYYHNAVIFERYGFSYQMGKRLMEVSMRVLLPAATPRTTGQADTFRKPEAAESIRKRSWAIHDRILGEPTHQCDNT